MWSYSVRLCVYDVIPICIRVVWNIFVDSLHVLKENYAYLHSSNKLPIKKTSTCSEFLMKMFDCVSDRLLHHHHLYGLQLPHFTSIPPDEIYWKRKALQEHFPKRMDIIINTRVRAGCTWYRTDVDEFIVPTAYYGNLSSHYTQLLKNTLSLCSFQSV